MARRRQPSGVPHPLLSDRAWLAERYEERELPLAAIAAEAGAHLSTVHGWLTRHEIPRRHGYEIDEDELRTLYAEGMPATAIADAYGVDRAVIYDRFYRLGLMRVQLELDVTREELRRWYERDGLSLTEIARRLGTTRRTATRQMLAAGIEIRPAGRRAG